ncbi:MAG: methylated-DNA--[protein]-cysteine S-methyltransferase [Planctomycetota bacterium]
MGVRLHLRRVRVPLLEVVFLAATAHGLVGVQLQDDEERFRVSLARRFPGSVLKGGNAVTTEAAREIRQYLGGGPDPKVDTVVPETGFQVCVWKQIARIPRGQVRSYGRLARAVRRPRAARAVGQACGRNPIPLVVPCHRVVAADGTLGGFGAGLVVKRKLLSLEGVRLRP